MYELDKAVPGGVERLAHAGLDLPTPSYIMRTYRCDKVCTAV